MVCTWSGIRGSTPTPSCSSHTTKFQWTDSRTSRMDTSAQTIVLKRLNQIAHDSPLAAIDSTSPETAECPPSTWSPSSSTKGAHYCTIDLKDFYLMTPMTHPEYMRMKSKDLPEEFVTMYNLTNKATADGFIDIKIQKGMYGLPQASILHTRTPGATSQ